MHFFCQNIYQESAREDYFIINYIVFMADNPKYNVLMAGNPKYNVFMPENLNKMS